MTGDGAGTAYFKNKLQMMGLNDVEIKLVCDAIDETCHHCWEAPNNCQCWNDD